ncbi:hypothetical protein [Desulfosoma caldarium]|uniref:Uncharacterized protein n=1 Tax=Desulfosoma caldarium TaxID=610254 RepID=A0A3N1VJJ6_9BACT|nr:hypothetical protein [Desulfosoma caldarium]ROR02975.1 hypothetical protein EDC27_0230 [Desulfosoma caldarium]
MARKEVKITGWLTILAVTATLWLLSIQGAAAAKIRITLNDGNRVEVPYCWEAKNTIFFEVPGGVAGLPKGQVRSIQEIVAGSEIAYDTVGSRVRTAGATDPDQQKAWAALLRGTPPETSTETLSPEELAQLLTSTTPSQEPRHAVRLYRTSFYPKGDVAQWMRGQKDGAVLLVKYLVNIPEDVPEKRFELILYDGHDRIVQRQPCSVQPVEVPAKLAEKLGLRGRLYAVVSKIKPDPDIRRYELATWR